MLSIILCHILQYFDNELAWWFNVGVQVFLFMSGFLYGKRATPSDDLKFIKKQFRKILIDYYVVVLPLLLATFLWARENCQHFRVINVLS